MRIALVCPCYPPLRGGIETHVRALAGELAERGCEVEVLTQVVRAQAGEATEGKVVVRRFAIPGRRERYTVSPRLLRTLRGGEYDVVHAHDYVPLAGMSVLGARRAFVYTPHYHGDRGQTALKRVAHVGFRPLAATAFRRADAVVCVSEAEAGVVRSHHPRAAAKIEVIPNGTGHRPPSASELPAGSLLSLGRLVGYKNIDEVIRALPRLDGSVRLRVVGDGPAREELGQLAGGLGLESRVEFTGTVDDHEVARALAEAGVLASMSTQEAFGLAPLDALACGLRVVASDIPAHRELAERWGGGRMELVGAGDDAALTRALEAALADRVRRVPADLPDWAGVAGLTLELYRRILATR